MILKPLQIWKENVNLHKKSQVKIIGSIECHSWIRDKTHYKLNRVLKLSHCVLTACSYQLMYFLINPKYVNYTDRVIY